MLIGFVERGVSGNVVVAVRFPAVEACSRCGGEMWSPIPFHEPALPGRVVVVCRDCAVEKAAEVIMECVE